MSVKVVIEFGAIWRDLYTGTSVLGRCGFVLTSGISDVIWGPALANRHHLATCRGARNIQNLLLPFNLSDAKS